MVQVNESLLIPGLPNEVAILCLSRVNWRDFKALRATCKSWASLLRSEEFYYTRKKIGQQEEWLFLLAGSISPGTLRIEAFDPLQIPPACVPSLISMHPHTTKLWGCQIVSVATSIYILGGSDGSPEHDVFSTVWKFHVVSGNWTLVSPMLEARHSFACGVVNGSIVVAGGWGNDQVPLSSAEIYKPELDEWFPLMEMQKSRAGCQGIVFDQHFHVFGGIGIRSGTDNVTKTTHMCSESISFEDNVSVGNPVEFEQVSETQKDTIVPKSHWLRVNGTWTTLALPGSLAVSQGRLFAVPDIAASLLEYSQLEKTWNVICPLTPQRGFRLVVLNGGLLLLGYQGGRWLEPQEKWPFQEAHPQHWSGLAELHNDILGVTTLAL